MQVVQLQQTQMLAESGLTAGRNSYGEANVQSWGDENTTNVKSHGNYVNWDND